ncbi:MAG: glycosyl hydrolase family 28-related protein [Clostridium sp.]
MRYTSNLKLPVYDNPSADIFKIVDHNVANEAIDKAYVEVKTMHDNIPLKNPDAEIVLARSGFSNLYEKVIDLENRVSKIKVDVTNFGAVGDGVTNNDYAISKAIEKVKQCSGILYFPVGTYLIGRSIETNGFSIEGSSYNAFNDSPTAKHTIIKCATKDFEAIKQTSTSGSGICYSVKNLKVVNALVGLKTTYTVNCDFENLAFGGCTKCIIFGDNSVLGGLFNTFKGIYCYNTTVSLEMAGNQWCNNNMFFNCYFTGEDYSTKILPNGGIGAVNNTFYNCEFHSKNSSKTGGRGIELTNAVNTTFYACYFETESACVYCDTNSSVTLDNCVFGSYLTINSKNDQAMIIGTNTSSNICIDGGYVYLKSDEPLQNSVIMLNHQLQERGMFTRLPRVSFGFPNFRYSNISNFNPTNCTSIVVLSDISTPRATFKNSDEQYGLEIVRNRAKGGTDYGAYFRFNNIKFFELDSSSTLNVVAPTTELQGATKVRNSFTVYGALPITLSSPNGKFWNVSVSNTGTLTVTEKV